MEPAARWLQERLGCQLGDPAMLRIALTHRSYGPDNNERLEFLGDAVLSFVIADLLCRAYPRAPEGELSRYRASLVSGEALGEISLALGVGDHLRLGDGELKSGGFRRASILADALEALFGAVFLDAGIDAARQLAERLFAERLAGLPAAAALKDPKTRLQEWLQARGLALPAYTVLQVSGEPHEQSFLVRCAVESLQAAADASGSSRRRAEQEAAERVLDLPAFKAKE